MNDSQREQLQQEVVRRYENLSDDLKRAMMSVSSAEIIYEVGRKHGLNVEKIGMLAEEIGYIILGMIPAVEFVPDLKKLLELEETKAREIAQEINQKIFLPIREEVKKVYGANFSDDVVGGQQNQPATPYQQPPVRPIPPPIPQRPLPPRPSTESTLGPRPPSSIIPDPQPTIPEFGSGPRMAIPNQPVIRPMPPFIQQPNPLITRQTEITPPPPQPAMNINETKPRERPVPPPIFNQRQEIAKDEKSIPPVENQEAKGGKREAELPEAGLPEVEEELKPRLLSSLPKEKPLEARIAEKNPPQYHLDPYKEPIE